MPSTTDPLAEKMSHASRTGEFRGEAVSPKKGERFRCKNCGLEVEVTQACHCNGADCAHFDCCGTEMEKE